jgi:uncharacterized protein
MAQPPSRFVWYELMTTDAAAAQRFYSEVIGWHAADAGLPDMRYTLLSTAQGAVAGLMDLPEDARRAGAHPVWLGYVEVDDVDAAAARVLAGGGRVCQGPQDIPGVGRFATITDPQGATLALYKGLSAQPPQPPAGTAGQVGWHELHAGPLAPAFDFYATQFGWQATESMDIGPLGTYQMFAMGGQSEGGMMTRPAAEPEAFWQYYVNVPALAPALARVSALGGQVLRGPDEVPGGVWVAQCTDPQGARFALMGPQG